MRHAIAEPRLAEDQMTRDEAIAFARERRWEPLSLEQRGLLLLRQKLLCIDFSEGHGGVEALLGRPVWTHEFADPDKLWNEYVGIFPRASFEDVLAKIPQHLKVVLIGGPGGERP